MIDWHLEDPLEQRLASIAAAFARVQESKSGTGDGDTEAAEHDLQATIDRARDEDVTWGAIGDALGMTRGNAYQRYRRRFGRP